MVQEKHIGLGVTALAVGSLAGLVVAALLGRRAGEKSAPRAATDDTQAPVARVAFEVSAATLNDGHVPTDLLPDADPGAGGRAIPAFRPDPTAPLEPAFREVLTGTPA